ncbi:ribosomal-protein-alanine acetyltransferase [uncultured Clostridium sp.]|uniref:GNAT family N-acetyltransferase n=1 Tax=uncultured Clostridium sp. TaxID=59620 RepID=UPI0008204B5C|nr:GNAT family N-acetyltransferase [uncultured Clostridium sp.]SCI90555.1 ribosomal-protein-alanine acetyltransferase [uncultured Clostridium sp.]
MDKIIYRNLMQKDYDTIKKLISEAFGFGEFIKDEVLLDTVTGFYLQECVDDSSFSKVAEKDNKVIGLILGKAKNDKISLKDIHNTTPIDEAAIGQVLADEDNRKVIKEFAKIQEVYKEIIKGREDNFEGCIQLFIVSKEARGFGIGKTLLSYLSEYMKANNVNSLYLYTDTRCNYGFYDSQNFKRLAEKELIFESIDAKLDVFLYGYKF